MELHTVRIWKHASIWSWSVENPQGGSFGSSCASGWPKRSAIYAATRNLDVGTHFRLIVNDRPSVISVKEEL